MDTQYALLNAPPGNERPVVAADLEGTLTAGTTWHALRDYLRAYGDERAYRNFFLRRLPGIVRFRLGLGDRQRFKYAWIRDIWALYEGYTEADLDEVAQWVVEEELWPARRREVLAELYDYARRGHRIVVVSGVAEPVLAAFIARAAAEQEPAFEGMGTPLHLEEAGGRDRTFSGSFRGEINIGEQKAAQLLPFSRDGKIEAAYGDTAPDVPMLAMSRHPVAVAPDPGLREAAVARGWRIIEAEL